MRPKRIVNERMYDVVNDLVKRASQDLFDYEFAFETRGGWKMFQRFDGMKYKDPNVIVFNNKDAKDIVSGKEKYINDTSKEKWDPIYKKMATTNSQKAIEQFWSWLQTQPNVKKANFRVSAEFGSSGYRDVLVLGTHIFILDGGQIQYGTKSLLRNSPIWRVEKLKEGIVSGRTNNEGNQVNEMRKLMEAVTLNEYLIRDGDKLSALLRLNIFGDILSIDVEELLFHDEDTGRVAPEWKPVLRKYTPIAKKLYTLIKSKGRRKLTSAEVAAAENAWYDGSDSYYGPEEGAEWLPGIYDNQIKVIKAILSGKIVDEYDDEIEEGIVGNAIKDAGRMMTGKVAEIDRVRKLTMLSFKDILRYATLLEEEAIDPVEAGNKIRALALDGIRAAHVKKK